MAHTLNINGYAFTGNPIAFRDTRRGIGAVPYSVIAGGRLRITGLYVPPCTIDAAEIIESYLEDIPDPIAMKQDERDWIIEVEGEMEISGRIVSVTYGDGKKLGQFVALKGGVSTENFRYLLDRNTDIFATRLLNPHANFFMTTRTHSWNLKIRETELYPLCILVDQGVTIGITPHATGYTYSQELRGSAIFALDIEALRLLIWEDHRYVASVFDVTIDGEFACRIVIEESPVVTERHLVKFRNSFGVFEVVEFTGKATLSETYSGSEEPEEAFDTRTRRYSKRGGCRARKNIASINSGTKRPEELAWIGDMLMSTEVYLKTDGIWARATAAAEKTERAERQTTPESITVKFEYSDTDSNSTPKIGEDTEFERPRIFSDEHTDIFN